ncbi:hypothetical protein [endosymbiont GvMRE of Glomus versiforme]|uniref:hypothetical protein n=1 Tax=endosymbiont GvMRE of Glomus versiforme TaxID=2039283 RepID=UPI000ED2462B|nr:hypothetical protein [endosymbiont GvMRE of Glomus versiforme]RHZ37106.1 hypothetical protein GvMRE_I1g29 [endosymbiont GvMRE of Glomus versiforme]
MEKKCFKCKKKIILKYVLSKKGYSLKNNWDYWTENPKHENKFICNSCLLDLYYNDKGKYLEEVKNNKKRRIFTAYVYNKTIS